jgi:hypothetical protein
MTPASTIENEPDPPLARAERHDGVHDRSETVLLRFASMLMVDRGRDCRLATVKRSVQEPGCGG